jgi:hypothetical protein
MVDLSALAVCPRPSTTGSDAKIFALASVSSILGVGVSFDCKRDPGFQTVGRALQQDFPDPMLRFFRLCPYYVGVS